MPVVLVARVVPGAPESAYALAKDMESYPEFMKDVVSLRVVRREGNVQWSEWVGRLQGKHLRWVEEDTFDDAAMTISYRQTEGDLKKFEGKWQFVPEPGGGTRVSLSVDFDLGVPMFAGLLHPVAGAVIRKNCEAMLSGLSERLAQ